MKLEKGKESYSVALVGATGMVGRKVLEILEERRFPVGELRLLASKRSAGKTAVFNGKTVGIRALHERELEGCDLAFFCAGGAISLEYAPLAARAGAVVIDKSSEFRMHEEVPLVVPEVNPADLEHAPENIVASPNCSTIPLVMVLGPLLSHAGITRVVVSTYQAASGAGKGGVDELLAQTRAELDGKPGPEPKTFSRRIAFNLLPHIDRFMDRGYTKEEWKLVRETRKILHLPDLALTCTAVRVPVLNSHSESVTIDFAEPVSPARVREILARAAGVLVMDDPEKPLYPVPEDATGRDEVLVGRIREDISRKGSINLWLVSDNIRKGAATNAVQIAESICQGPPRSR
jgi:aspartate-semialdehyde dehydrogenase